MRVHKRLARKEKTEREVKKEKMTMNKYPYFCSGGNQVVLGGRGVTVWGNTDTDETLSAGGGSYEWSFTGTRPTCYQSMNDNILRADNINVNFVIHTDTNAPQQNNEVGPIEFYVNGKHQGNRYHSRLAGHDLIETIDIAQSTWNGNENYCIENDTGLNKIKFVNQDTSVNVTIKDLRIVRVYGMCNMGAEYSGDCVYAGDCSEETDCDNCFAEDTYPATGAFDCYREDTPCNGETCGLQLCYTKFGDDNHCKSISAGANDTWTWTNPDNDASYYWGPHICFFNFNNVQLSADSDYNDVPLGITMNGDTNPAHEKIVYMTKVKETGGYTHSAAVSCELNNCFSDPTLGYNDAPGAQNTLKLTNKSDQTIWLCDGCSSTCNGLCGGNVDVYRIYNGVNKCQDDFNDETMGPWWTELKHGSSSTSEENDKLQVSVNGFGGAGYVTLFKHNMLQHFGDGLETKINVTNNALQHMGLAISNQKTINSSPFDLDNSYSIYKTYNDDGKYVVTRKINNNNSVKATGNWVHPNGILRIAAAAGSIAFYENGQLRYAEPFALPESKCHIYVYGNLAIPWPSAGTFDDYVTTTPSPSRVFRDTFDDTVYTDEWETIDGSWTADYHTLRSTTTDSKIKVKNKTFSKDIHMAANIKTIDIGGNAWDVSWLMVRENNVNNRVYALLKNDNIVELTAKQYGYAFTFTAYTDKSPLDEESHRIAVTIIGNDAKLWLDEELLIENSHPAFGSVTGYPALYTPASTGEFDNVVILAESIT